MAFPKNSCSNCTHWVPKDPSLDGGRELLGTCTAFKDYDTVSNDAYRASCWSEAGYLVGMRKQVKEQGALLQTTGGDGGNRAYLRTAASFSCARHTSVTADLKPSLTEQGSRH